MTPIPPPDPAQLAEGVLAGRRRALARAITLVESSRADHRRLARQLLERVMPATGKAIRIGISGAPGVGKSTFIEALGMHVLGQGQRLAVLAVDPSSCLSGGSILGDKTRMQELGRQPGAFIRPSPAGSELGGVARRTRESMLLCEAAGFSVIFVETVGVGQSETEVAGMTDMFLLLLQPGGGDELQGIKRGIVELADLLLVNKADGELAAAARHSAADYRMALHLLHPRTPGWEVPVLTCSALTGEGIPAVWETIERYRRLLTESGELVARRSRQARSWLWSEITAELLSRFRADPAVRERLPAVEEAVTGGRLPPARAAEELLERFLGEKR
ncbi:MAG TPA: methylmalonyl Co-A mutase-associated GTPase MeaB [Sedimenticola sp.]|nr:methylmalonyl Co-A mutase-associated GTPase MeaB [Sedimenticola sp.]